MKDYIFLLICDIFVWLIFFGFEFRGVVDYDEVVRVVVLIFVGFLFLILVFLLVEISDFVGLLRFLIDGWWLSINVMS